MKETKLKKPKEKTICGIVMPISSIDGCSETHWNDVMEIINEAIEDAGFEPNLVSNADDVGVIQKRIIQNLYDNPVVVCDVSGKNPNVMFELGIRLAFDKPTIIIKDDKTSYSFDTSAIEHIEYPRDLRFNKIQEFKAKLSEKISNTHQKASTDPKFSTFLKHFGEFKVAKIEQKEVSQQEFIIDELKNLRSLIVSAPRRGGYEYQGFDYLQKKNQVDQCCEPLNLQEVEHLVSLISKKFPEVISACEIVNRGPNHLHLLATCSKPEFKSKIRAELRTLLRHRRIAANGSNRTGHNSD
jgi:hypothetical protein